MHNGVIKKKGRIWVGINTIAQQHILQALHAGAVGGHSGVQATYQRIKALFAWPKLKQTITQFVQGCQICQQAKHEHVKLPRLLQPLPVPEQAWHTVSLDFIEGLPKSYKWDVILVVVDKFSKYAHFCLFPIHTLHYRLLRPISTIYISFMGCLVPSSLIGTGFSQVHYGSSCSLCQILNFS